MQNSRSSRTIYIVALALTATVVIGRVLYFLPEYKRGEAAPDFVATLPDGQTFRLSDLRGRYVLLHFWGSWCGPCRLENPKLRDLYLRYENRGFTIVSIGVEKDTVRWQRAIAQDGLTWPYHFIQVTPSLRFFDTPLANQFGIKKLPTLILVEPQGNIEQVNPDVEALEARLRTAVR